MFPCEQNIIWNDASQMLGHFYEYILPTSLVIS